MSSKVTHIELGAIWLRPYGSAPPNYQPAAVQSHGFLQDAHWFPLGLLAISVIVPCIDDLCTRTAQLS